MNRTSQAIVIALAALAGFTLADRLAAQSAPAMMPYVAVHEPVFVKPAEASFVQDDDFVISIAKGSTAKAYMTLHLGQIGSVDDTMPDGPIEVTFCSTCGTGAVFRADLDGRRLHFEYDSMQNANEVHKDVETGSRWQQSTGEAISGPLKGKTLTLYPFIMSSRKEWRTRHPKTTVLKPAPGYMERVAILRPRQKQSLRSGEGAAPDGAFGKDDRLRPREMIAGLAVGSETMAFPLSALRTARVVNERLGGVRTLREGPAQRHTAEAADSDSGVLVCVVAVQAGHAPFHGSDAMSAQLSAPRGVIARHALTGSLAGFDLVLLESARSSSAAAEHQHPGAVLGYVLDGQLRFGINHEPPHVVPAGGTFFEPKGAVHTMNESVDGDRPARFLALLVVPTGGPLVGA